MKTWMLVLPALCFSFGCGEGAGTFGSNDSLPPAPEGYVAPEGGGGGAGTSSIVGPGYPGMEPKKDAAEPAKEGEPKPDAPATEPAPAETPATEPAPAPAETPATEPAPATEPKPPGR